MAHHAEHTRPLLYQKIAFTFFIAAILLMLIVFYISFSWATITITPKPQALDSTFLAQITDPSGAPASPGTLQIPGSVSQKEMEGRGTFSATGAVQHPEPQQTKGTVTIVNMNSKDQPLRATTRLLSSDGVLFRTLSFVTVPAGGKVSVEVVKDAKSSREAMDTTHFTLPGLWPGLQQKIYGVNFEQQGQGTGTMTLVTQEDVDNAASTLIEKLKDKYQALLSYSVGGGKDIVAEIRLDKSTITPSVPVGQAAGSFDIRVKAIMTAVSYDRGVFLQNIKNALAASAGPGYAILPLLPGNVSLSFDSVDVAAGEARAHIAVSAQKVRSDDDAGISKKDLTGRTAAEIRAYYESQEGVHDVDVALYPFWVTRAPYLLDHISVRVKR